MNNEKFTERFSNTEGAWVVVAPRTVPGILICSKRDSWVGATQIDAGGYRAGGRRRELYKQEGATLRKNVLIKVVQTEPRILKMRP